jgi:predicted HTH transcriptional regulator
MDIVALKKLVLKGEGQTLEFKRKANHPEKIVREMVAFANTNSGILLIGVEDDKTIYGSKNPEEEIFAVTHHLELYAPSIHYTFEKVAISQKREVLVFYIKESQEKPVYLTNYLQPKEKSAFVRAADKSILASLEMEYILRYRSLQAGVRFRFGEREKQILVYLEKNPAITLDIAQQFLNLGRKQTSITLVTLVRAGILNIHPTEHGDFFRLEEKAFE